MIISVDHGNKSIKTPNTLFTSGLIVSDAWWRQSSCAPTISSPGYWGWLS